MSFAYHEQVTSDFERLTDEAWHEQVAGAEDVEWMKPVLAVTPDVASMDCDALRFGGCGDGTKRTPPAAHPDVGRLFLRRHAPRRGNGYGQQRANRLHVRA